jgi:hypothetical protein
VDTQPHAYSEGPASRQQESPGAQARGTAGLWVPVGSITCAGILAELRITLREHDQPAVFGDRQPTRRSNTGKIRQRSGQRMSRVRIVTKQILL